MSKLPPKEDRGYGFFGYRGYVTELAIKRDDPEMMKECIDLGFIDAECEMLGGGTVLAHCEKVAPKCAAALRGE